MCVNEIVFGIDLYMMIISNKERNQLHEQPNNLNYNTNIIEFIHFKYSNCNDAFFVMWETQKQMNK